MDSTSKEELAYRRSSGIDVTLLWDRRSGELTVDVADWASGTSFQLPAAPEEALAVFHHPYAYAALEGTRHRASARTAA